MLTYRARIRKYVNRNKPNLKDPTIRDDLFMDL
jgi:hypothetical protein